MIDVLIKRVSVTYKCYEMYAHRLTPTESRFTENKKLVHCCTDLMTIRQTL
jgi:ribosomal protein S17E